MAQVKKTIGQAAAGISATAYMNAIENTKAVSPLTDEDTIVCTAQVPNMTYKDHKTGDLYRWDNINDTEDIPFSVIKDIYRNYGKYITDLWFTFDDERIIEKFRLKNLYNSYKDLIDSKTYKNKNLSSINEKLKDVPSGVINTIISKVKSFVNTGEISNLRTIKELEKLFKIDLTSLI